jgi:hypothetical protein
VIRRHPLISAGIALVILVPLGTLFAVAIELARTYSRPKVVNK